MRRRRFVPSGDGLEPRRLLSNVGGGGGPAVTTTTSTTNWTASNGDSMQTITTTKDEPYYTTGSVAPYGTVRFWSDLHSVDTNVRDLTAGTRTDTLVSTQPTVFEANYTDSSGNAIELLGEYNPQTTVTKTYAANGSYTTSTQTPSVPSSPANWVGEPGQTQPGDPEPVSPTLPKNGTDPEPPSGNGDPPADSPSIPGGTDLPGANTIYIWSQVDVASDGDTDQYTFSENYAITNS